MKFNDSLFFAISAGLWSGLSTTSAHVGVGNRTFDGDAATAGFQPIDGGTFAIHSAFVTTNSGWADATDANWGDSHHTRAFLFTLASTQNVTITVQRNDTGQTGPTGVFLPAFSLFTTPEFRAETHDTGPATRAYLTSTFGTSAAGESFVDANLNGVWNVGETFTDGNGNGVYDSAGIEGSGKEGAFRALDPWEIYVDAVNGLPMYFDKIKGHAADGTSANYGNASGIQGDGVADGLVSATFNDLEAGDYYLFVGGANYLAQNTEGLTYGPGANALPNYGINVIVAAVPEPTSAALLGLGTAGLALLRRPRNHRIHQP